MESERRIALVAPFPPLIGGMAQLANRLAAGLAGSGWVVFPVRKGVGWKGACALPMFYWRLVAAAVRCRAVLVVSASGRSLLARDLPALLVATAFGRPTVLNFVGGGVETWGNTAGYLRRLPFRLADRVVVPTRRQESATAGLRPGCTIDVIPNAVDVAPFTASSSAEPRRPILVAAKNLVPFAGVDLLIRSFVDVKRAVPDAELKICGEGPCRRELESLVEQAALSGVRFLGAVPHVSMPGILGDAAVFVHGTRYESFGIALVESMAAGAPVVAFSVGGIPEVVRDGTDGFLVAYGDLPAFSDAVIRLLKAPGLRAEMGKAAQQGARRYSWEVVQDQWRDLLGGL